MGQTTGAGCWLTQAATGCLRSRHSSARSRGKVRGEIPAVSPIRSRALWTLIRARQMQRSCSRSLSFESICQEGATRHRTTFGLSYAPAPRWSRSRSRRSPASLSTGLVGEWLADATATSGKPTRLEFLRERLGRGRVDLSGLRYQLLHRAASALVQADRFGAGIAVLLLHSFGGHADDRSREDYQRFAEVMACPPTFNALVGVGRPTKRPLLIGWLADVPAGVEAVARAL